MVALCLSLCLFGCDKKAQEIKITGEDTKVMSRLENIIELQKSLFRAKITKVETVDCVISKYDFDLSKYIKLTVDIIDCYDEYTPTGTAELYWAGTEEEFASRIVPLEKETYIFDAEPWIYGDKTVYLLYPGTASYPRVDSADAITIATSSTEALSVGTLATYRDEYNKAKASLEKRIPDFFEAKNAAARYEKQFNEVLTKNSDKAKYTERGYKWVPSDDFINTTVNRSQEVYDKAKSLVRDDVTKEEIKQLLK